MFTARGRPILRQHLDIVPRLVHSGLTTLSAGQVVEFEPLENHCAPALRSKVESRRGRALKNAVCRIGQRTTAEGSGAGPSNTGS